MRVTDKLRRRICETCLFLLAVVTILGLLGWAERERNADEEYAVYSAYLSEGLLNDPHDWSVGGPIQVVVWGTTRAGGNLRFRALLALAPCDSRNCKRQLGSVISFAIYFKLESCPSLCCQATQPLPSHHNLNIPHRILKRSSRATWV